MNGQGFNTNTDVEKFAALAIETGAILNRLFTKWRTTAFQDFAQFIAGH